MTDNESGPKEHGLKHFTRTAPLGILLLAALGLGYAWERTQASPGLFSERCASCHYDDTPTCAGCHQHRGALNASADQTSYAPGQTVTVTLRGGVLGGWIRGLLYDANGIELDRAGGPDGTGDNGQGNPVTFPVTLQAPAPAQPGDYVWRAGWYGSNNAGSGHFETTVPVTIHVEDGAVAPEDRLIRGLELRISPNPCPAGASLHLLAETSGEPARLFVIDPAGRLVRVWSAQTSAPGVHQMTWDGIDVNAGTYLAVLATPLGTVVRPVVIVH